MLQKVSWARSCGGTKSLGHDVTGVISLTQEVLGQNLSGAGRRGAGRGWGIISWAGGHGAEGSGAESRNPLREGHMK